MRHLSVQTVGFDRDVPHVITAHAQMVRLPPQETVSMGQNSLRYSNSGRGVALVGEIARLHLSQLGFGVQVVSVRVDFKSAFDCH